MPRNVFSLCRENPSNHMKDIILFPQIFVENAIKADDLYAQGWFPGSKLPGHRSSVDSGYGDYDCTDIEYESDE